jgi:excisionase family DNA binding protein
MGTPVAEARWLRASEVAQMVGVDPSRVRLLVQSGDLRSVRLGAQGWHRFLREDVETLIREGRAP